MCLYMLHNNPGLHPQRHTWYVCVFVVACIVGRPAAVGSLFLVCGLMYTSLLCDNLLCVLIRALPVLAMHTKCQEPEGGVRMNPVAMEQCWGKDVHMPFLQRDGHVFCAIRDVL
jgi:hypothetical protein